MRRQLLTAAAAKDAPAAALYEVAKMYDTGAYGAVPSTKKAVEFYEAVRWDLGYLGVFWNYGVCGRWW